MLGFVNVNNVERSQRPMAGSWRGTARREENVLVRQMEKTHVAIAACDVDLIEIIRVSML